jgi:hypothetical protein
LTQQFGSIDAHGISTHDSTLASAAFWEAEA